MPIETKLGDSYTRVLMESPPERLIFLYLFIGPEEEVEGRTVFAPSFQLDRVRRFPASSCLPQSIGMLWPRRSFTDLCLESVSNVLLGQFRIFAHGYILDRAGHTCRRFLIPE